MATLQDQINTLNESLQDLIEEFEALTSAVLTNTSGIAALDSLTTRVENIEEKLTLITVPSEARTYLSRQGLTNLSNQVAQMTALASELETLRGRLLGIISQLGVAVA